jgi:hypothetical protein
MNAPILIEVQSCNGRRGDGFRSEIIEAPAGSTDAEIEAIARGWYEENHAFNWKRAACQRKGGCNSQMACRILKDCYEQAARHANKWEPLHDDK